MLSDKELKKQYLKKASKNPEEYFAVDVLKSEGFKRAQCKCGTFFWVTHNSKTCDDPSCSGGFKFFKDNPAKNKLDYVGVWKAFSAFRTTLPTGRDDCTSSVFLMVLEKHVKPSFKIIQLPYVVDVR